MREGHQSGNGAATWMEEAPRMLTVYGSAISYYTGKLEGYIR